MRTLNPMLAGTLVLSAFAVSARAHDYPCAHFHEPTNRDHLISCTNDNAACTLEGCGGTCREVQDTSSSICTCVVPGGNSVSLGVYYFDDQDAGPPSPVSSVIYLATGDSINAASVFVGNNPGLDFDAEIPFVGGTFTIAFPSFAPGEPEVVATLDNVSLSFAPVGGSGTNLVALADGFSQLVVYNDATGILAPADSGGILLHLDNNYFDNRLVHLYFEGRYRPDGSLDVAFQHNSIRTLFADGLEWGNTSLWSITSP